MAKAAGASGGAVELLHFHDLSAHDRRDHELGDAITRLDSYRMLAQVDQYHLDLAAIISVDCTRRVNETQSLLQGATAARAHLSFKPWRDLESDSGWHCNTTEWRERNRLVHGSDQVQSGGVLALVARDFPPQKLKFNDRNNHRMYEAGRHAGDVALAGKKP
jgi:hypothetical protein